MFLTPEEITCLFQLELPTKVVAVFAVAIYAGLRKGELWGLRWRDVELEGVRPHVRVRRSRRAGPKSTRSRRDVPLFKPARDALRTWRREQQSSTSVRSIASAGELVFPNASGEMHSESFQASWPDKRERRGQMQADGSLALRVVQGWKSKAGISRPFRFHDMRHTCASHLVMGTWGRVWSLYEVKEFMGHSDIKVTQRYAHLSPQSIHGARAEMEAGGWEDD